MKKISLLLLMTLLSFVGFGQAVYVNGFGSTTASPGDAPSTINSNMGYSSWGISTGSFTSYAGASGQALSMSSAAAATTTWTLPLTVSSGYRLALTSFSFWNRASSTGYTNWQLDVNGTVIGSGTVSSSGASTGTVSITGTALTAVSNLTGAVSVHLIWSGGTHGSSGTGRLDDITLNGTVTAYGCTGKPVAGVLSSVSSNVCQNATTQLTDNGVTYGSGISYLWQSSANAVSWTNIIGATDTSYTPSSITATTYYRTIATCAVSGLSDTTNTATITTLPLANPTISGSVTITQGSSAAIVFTGATGDRIQYNNGSTSFYDTLFATTDTITVSPTVTTTYTITNATSANGCSHTITGQAVTITIQSTNNTTPTRDDNLAMGNPSNATSNIAQSNNYLMTKTQYTLSYNNSKGIANWVSWHLSAAWLDTSDRCDCFTQDETLPSGYYKASTGNYTGTGFDRGHLCPSADRTGSDADNAITFKMTNITPQSSSMNSGPWGVLEGYCRSLVAQGKELYIMAGGYGSGGNGSNGGTTTTIASGNISVPNSFYKIIVVLPVGSNDVTRITKSTQVISVIMPNTQTANTHSWDYYRTSVDSIEMLTGYNFLSNVPDSIQTVIESNANSGPHTIAAWDFTGASAPSTFAATTFDANLNATSSLSNITRGGTAAASAGANSFRTTGFKNEGISTANTDYFQTTIRAKEGYTVSLTSLSAVFAGTSTFYATPGVTSQFAYSRNGSSFTLIDTPVTSTALSLTDVDLSAISALQNVPDSVTITLRYYASGQTTTGGWGFYSSSTGTNGLTIAGSVDTLGATGMKHVPVNMSSANISTLVALVYPNPASTEIKIRYKADGVNNTTVKIWNLTGTLVYSQNLGIQKEGSIVIPVAELNSGFYITELFSGAERVRQLVFKK